MHYEGDLLADIADPDSGPVSQADLDAAEDEWGGIQSSEARQSDPEEVEE